MPDKASIVERRYLRAAAPAGVSKEGLPPATGEDLVWRQGLGVAGEATTTVLAEALGQGNNFGVQEDSEQEGQVQEDAEAGEDEESDDSEKESEVEEEDIEEVSSFGNAPGRLAARRRLTRVPFALVCRST